MAPARASLGVLGFTFGGVTATVMLVVCTAVLGHVAGRFALDPPLSQITALQ